MIYSGKKYQEILALQKKHEQQRNISNGITITRAMVCKRDRI